MGVDLFFSNHLEHLAEKLALNIDAERQATADPFLPIKIIVPNNNLAKWLTLIMARRESIVMNVDYQFLESGLWEMIAALDTWPQPARMLDKIRARLLILSVLSHMNREDPDLAPLADYLFNTEGVKHPDYPVRLWQLSERLAHLFQEYEYHRTDMIRQWRAGHLQSDHRPDDLPGDPNDLARCEQRVYLLAIEARNTALNPTLGSVLSLMEYAEEILADAGKLSPATPGSNRVHFFGLSQVSGFHLSVINQLNPFYNMSVYALNPSQEFWEDIQTPAEKRWVKRKNARLSIQDAEKEAGELFNTQDHPLLAAWGKSGRESIRLLCCLTDYTFNAGFSPVGKIDTVLKDVQTDILTLGTPSPPIRLSQDRSLQIYGCPGIQREVETVYQNILFNLSTDSHLRLNDIAVLVPDITVYKPVFDMVFNRLPRQLAYNLVDSRANIESVYGQAILGLLSLVTERFSRKNVFELILNPCLQHKWRIGTDEVRIWAKWAESLNIFHSFERNASSADDGPKSGRYSWKQGLQRLRLARLFTTDAGGKTGPNHFKNLVPFNDTTTGDADLLEKFCRVIETLDRLVNTLRLGHASADRWRTMLLNASRQLFSIPPDYRGEVAVRQALFQALDDFTFFDRQPSPPGDPPGEPPEDPSGDPSGDPFVLDATLVAEYLRFCLGSISGGSGDYLTGGVTVSELQPMRPIPFKIIYVLGMEEGNFPGRADSSILDLRLKKRRLGDVSLPERNRYLFLETVLAAREKLYISFISRDLQKDRVLQPCTVVNQLKRYLEQYILPEKDLFQLGTIPLKGSSPAYVKPDAITTWSDVRVNFNLVDRIACYRFAGLWPEVKAKISDSDTRRVAPLNPDLSISDPSLSIETNDNGDEEHLQLWRLKRFLMDPVAESVQRHLGLYAEETGLEDMVQVEDESFSSQYPLNWRLKLQPIHQWLDATLEPPESTDEHQPLSQIFERCYADYHRQGDTPEGWFATVDKAALNDKLSALETALTPFVNRMRSAKDSLAMVIIGAPAEPMDMTNHHHILQFDPISLPVVYRSEGGHTVSALVRLHGQLRWLWRENETGWHVLVPTGTENPGKKPGKYTLQPVLFYLSCLVTPSTRDWIGDFPLTIHLTGAKKSSGFIFQTSEDDARVYLAELISEYLTRKNHLWLPLDIITRCAINPLEIDPTTIDPGLRARFREEMIAAFGENAGELDRLIHPDFPPNFPLSLLDRAIDRFQILNKLQPISD